MGDPFTDPATAKAPCRLVHPCSEWEAFLVCLWQRDEARREFIEDSSRFYGWTDVSVTKRWYRLREDRTDQDDDGYEECAKDAEGALGPYWRVARGVRRPPVSARVQGDS